MQSVIHELHTLRDWLRWAVSRFHEADLFFGHGCDNAYDEAVWLILHTLHLPPDRLEPFLDARLTESERLAVLGILQQRMVHRLPAAYLTGEAWLGGFRFRIDERVIVPRSYFAELLADGFAPWIDDAYSISSALDLCTGSGCLAILMAQAFPNARIDAVDLSPDAIEVAHGNVSDYGLDDQINLIQSDLFDELGNQRYDFILSNPPYVTGDAMASLPPEYRHEPTMALAAGDDGLDIVRRLLAESRRHLNPGGLLAVEVGHNQSIVEDAFPEQPMTWIDTPSGEGKIFLVAYDDLP
ncbi:MAG: 50S ribosomal protein L3 N(5)-glutamine methyltransferase [Rhodocyclaceae bacterium]|nr:50S ribosomal protein L3 N(5)-glutamine methyltransferase [Rhodocyclaceae bacterium]